MKRFSHWLCLGVVATPCLGFAQPKYKVTPLGSIPGQTVQTVEMNNQGQIVGNTNSGIFIWEEGSGFSTMNIGTGTRAYDINNLGQIVGGCGINNSTQTYVWTRQNGFQTIDPGGSFGSIGIAISDSGLIAATRYFTSNERRPSLYDPATGWTDLGTPWPDGRWLPQAMNNQGHAVGSGYVNFSQLTSGLAYYSRETGPIGLGIPQGMTQAIPARINDDDVIAGSYTREDAALVGFVRQPDGTITLMDQPLQGGESQAYAVNNAGQVVGWYNIGPTGYGYMYTPEMGMVNLDNFLDPSYSDYHIHVALDISDTGYILASAQYQGKYIDVRLDPIVPEAPHWLGFVGVLGLLGLKKRRP